jgi:type IV pilus assembly protein PilY1
MKPIKILFILVLLLPLFAVNSFAKDTDIYAARGQGVQPNILIIFDNSLSMGSQDGYVVPCNPIPTRIYKKTYPAWAGGNAYWPEYALSINDLPSNFCSAAKNALQENGHYEGYTTTSHSSCSANNAAIATGSYLNAIYGQQDNALCIKLDVAKMVITDFLTNINDVRVGLMIFNSQGCEKHEDGNCICNKYHGVERRNADGSCRDGNDNNNEYEGGHILSFIDSISGSRNALIAAVSSIQAETYTPLAETLYEAGLYFKGVNSLFNNDAGGNRKQYVSPIQFSCQKNYVIIITDGKSTMDKNAVLSTVVGDYDGQHEDPGNYSSDGTDYLNDVAKYLYDSPQKISTYTIGFTINYDLLERTAYQGNGHYYFVEDAQGLSTAFLNVIDEILAKSTSFVAPIVPVSRMERTSAGDKLYLALFKPQPHTMWYGNIKMYGVAQNDVSGQYVKGDVLDRNNQKAISGSNFIEASISYWNTTQDGGEVEKGGAGEVLHKRTQDRDIYTYFAAKNNVVLKHNDHAFTTSNASITLGVLGLSSTGDAQQDTDKKNALINFVHGEDAYRDESSDETAKRKWILGSFLHSRPFLIHYTNKNVVYAGSNDGMLHAFDDSDGSELWAFIPPDLLPTLQYLHSDQNESFVDGSPKPYVSYEYNGDGSIKSVTNAILIFGERRGGNRYYALDVTDYNNPKFLWEINPTGRRYMTNSYATTDYQELGQTWSSPIIGKIACSGGGTCVGGEKWVAFIGGGYDNDNQDYENLTPEHQGHPYTDVADFKGRAVYVVDISDGSLVKRFSIIDSGYSDMTYSIPSDITKVDVDGDGKVDRLYVGDMAGRMWRFDIKDTNPSNWTGKIIFKSNPDGQTTNLRKIFYPPDVTLELDDSGASKGNYELLIFGTGDREHPNDKIIINRLYALKDRNLQDKNPQTAYTESDLVDVTTDLLQTGTADEKTDTLNQLKANSGWFVQLLPSDSGEKCLAPPVVFYKWAYFTTFGPSPDAPPPGQDPCYVGEGTAKMYLLEYKNANAVFNFDLTNDIGETKVYVKSDRSTTVGTAIPSGVIITFIGGTAVAYTGVGGGVYIPKLAGTKSLLPVNWRIVF